VNDIIDQHINAVVAALLPYAPTLDEAVLRTTLRNIAETAYTTGRADALQSLRTGTEAAEIWGVTRQRSNVRIHRLHKQHGVGIKVGPIWLLTTDEIERWRPDPHAKRPRKG
jgi:hypothetical protein